MAEHRSDDEMVVAAGWAVVRGLGVEVTRRQLMQHTQVRAAAGKGEGEGRGGGGIWGSGGDRGDFG
jgi:hypothetical protein